MHRIGREEVGVKIDDNGRESMAHTREHVRKYAIET